MKNRSAAVESRPGCSRGSAGCSKQSIGWSKAPNCCAEESIGCSKPLIGHCGAHCGVHCIRKQIPRTYPQRRCTLDGVHCGRRAHTHTHTHARLPTNSLATSVAFSVFSHTRVGLPPRRSAPDSLSLGSPSVHPLTLPLTHPLPELHASGAKA